MKGRFFKRGGGYWPLRREDKEAFANFKQGEVFEGDLSRQSPRSRRHHGLYFAGLIGLVKQYWVPTAGLITPAERYTANRIASILERESGNTGAVSGRIDEIMDALARRRAETVTPPEMSDSDLTKAIHRWIKEEIGFYDLIQTPGGIRKELKSINWNSLDQPGFFIFYTQAFGCAWNYILSQHFETESDATNAINQLLAMGG